MKKRPKKETCQYHRLSRKKCRCYDSFAVHYWDAAKVLYEEVKEAWKEGR